MVVLNSPVFLDFKRSAVMENRGNTGRGESQGMLLNAEEPGRISEHVSTLSYFAAMYSLALSGQNSQVVCLYFQASFLKDAKQNHCLWGVAGVLRSWCSQLMSRFPGEQNFFSGPFSNERYREIYDGEVKTLINLFNELLRSVERLYGVRKAVPITCIIDSTHLLENFHQEDFYDLLQCLRENARLCKTGASRGKLEFKYLLLHPTKSNYTDEGWSAILERRVYVDPIPGNPTSFLLGRSCRVISCQIQTRKVLFPCEIETSVCQANFVHLAAPRFIPFHGETPPPEMMQETGVEQAVEEVSTE